MRAARLLTLTFSAMALSGCVAAAIPLVAGGALTRAQTNKGPAAKASVEPEIQLSTNAEAKLAAPDIAQTGPGSGDDRANALLPMAATIQFEQFVRYSTEQAYRLTEQGQALQSAVLTEPSSLDGSRVSCDPNGQTAPAILIDLDPGDERFDEGAPLPASASIALSLEVLRSEGVEIAWISRNSAANADVIRDALTSTGLDPESNDTLLLMRYPDDRKQTRREEFASETCLIAIAGDERRDFDELFAYLTNPDAAIELEPLMNNGWFLITSSTLIDIPPEPIESDGPAQTTENGKPQL